MHKKMILEPPEWEQVVEPFLATSKRGQPGVNHSSCQTYGVTIETLVYRDLGGAIRGILTFCPQGVPAEGVAPGDVFIVVQPSRRRQGIASRLLDEAFHHWFIDLEHQRLSPDGMAFINAWEKS